MHKFKGNGISHCEAIIAPRQENTEQKENYNLKSFEESCGHEEMRGKYWEKNNTMNPTK